MIQNNLKSDCPLIIKISILLYSTWIFFSYLLSTNIRFLSLFVIVLFTAIVCLSQRLKFNTISVLYLMCVLYVVFSIYRAYGYIYSCYIILGFLTLILYSNLTNWQEYAIHSFGFISAIHVFSTVLTYFFPSTMNKICAIILNSQQYTANQGFKLGGVNPGITNQTGINSIYICIFIAIIFCKFLLSEKKIKLFFLLLIGIFAILLTAKRGVIIFSFVVMFIVSLLIPDISIKLKYVFLFAAVLLITYLLLINVEGADAILKKFERLENTNDMMNGRQDLWAIAIEAFQSNPLFGKGIGYMSKTTGTGAHNIYLQLLSEYGLIGFIIFVGAIFFSLIKSFCLMKNTDFINEKNKFYFILTSVYFQLIFVIYGFTGNPLFDVQVFIIYLFFVSIVNSYLIQMREEARSRNETSIYIKS